MSDFNEALKTVLQAEGPGGVIDPQDPGGLTVWGITRTYEQTWPGWPRFDDLHKSVSRPVAGGQPVTWAQDEQLMAYVTAYYRQVWESMLLDGVKSQTLATSVFGAFVNEGPKVVRWLQAAAGATVDGVWGPATIAAANAAPCVWEKFSILRLKYYNQTAKDVYLRGLFDRVLVVGA
ncbi:MAG: glycosyl hydrolase 108 family protein [bacterium]